MKMPKSRSASGARKKKPRSTSKRFEVVVSPIRSESDLEQALAQLGPLLECAPGTAEEARLEVLSELIRAYELRHHPIGPPDPIEAIRFRLEQQGLKAADLARILGSRSHAYEVLKGSRRLSVQMIRVLHRDLQVPLESLIG